MSNAKRTEADFRKALEANADAIFVRTSNKFGHVVDLPLSWIEDEEEKERHFKIIIDRQLKAQEAKK